MSLIVNRFSECRKVVDRWGVEDLGEGLFGVKADGVQADKGNWLVEKDKQMACLEDGYKLVYRYFSENN